MRGVLEGADAMCPSFELPVHGRRYVGLEQLLDFMCMRRLFMPSMQTLRAGDPFEGGSTNADRAAIANELRAHLATPSLSPTACSPRDPAARDNSE